MFKFLWKPLETKCCMIWFAIKTRLLLFSICWLIVAASAATQLQQQPQTLNYKQQLQYQMQQHDKFEYQQQIKQHQQYYQQQYHQQQQPPTAMALLQEQQYQNQQQQQRLQHQHQNQQQQQHYLAVKPSQILQTAASLVVDDGLHSEALALGQPEYFSGNAQRRRPGNRKRKRRPQPAAGEGIESPTASNSPPYWRGQVENESLNVSAKSPTTKIQEAEDMVRPSLQTSFKRRKQPAIREPLAALEKEQKLYEMRNKAETSTAESFSRNSANLKNILKNNGGLSLSEILQQKNLSLDDLLKGKHNALQALQTTATAPLEKVNHAKYPSFKANYKPSAPTTIKLTDGSGEERSKLNALHRLKLFGSSSRPSGLQVGLADHLTTRKREGNIYSSTTTTTTTKTTPKPPTTKIPLYKKILHQRPTLKPTFLLKNTAIMASAEPTRIITSWDSKEQPEDDIEEPVEMKEEEKENDNVEVIDEEEDMAPEILELSTKLPPLTETTTWQLETTMAPDTTSSSTTASTTTSTSKPSTEKTTNRDFNTSTRRMFVSTRGSGRTTYRYTSSTSTPAAKSSTTTTTTTTPLPLTTTITTSTTTASSSTMNLTPKANLNLNNEDLRERIQETLLKNLIEKEDSFKKSSSTEERGYDNANDNSDDDNDDDLENFFEETVKPKSTKYFESSTITTRMKQYTPAVFSYDGTTTSTTSSPLVKALNPTTENLNVIPDFDNVDDRTDLLELIEDRRSGNRLFKVLEQRNMTLEELIEHRKRGSSQLHLATIVESPSRFYPDKKVVLQDNMDIVTAFENFPHFNLLNLKSVKPDDIKTDSQGASYFTSIIDIEPTDEVYKNRKGGQALTAVQDKATLLPDRLEKSMGFFPSWKTLALASLATTNNNKDAANMRNTNSSPYYLQQPKMLLENNSDNSENDEDEDVYDIKENELTLIGGHDQDDSENDYQAQIPIQAAVRLPEHTAEAIENEVARAHDLVDLELSGHGFKRSPQAAGALAHSHRHASFYTNMPPGIKSAIVASATIVLTALITFMVILAVCKWKQRRHRMSNIMKSYHAMKSKLPSIATTSTVGALATASGTNSTSQRSSFREMQNLLGGSGLSMAATITTTSTGVPNTPLHNTSNPCATSIPTTPLLTASQTATMLAGNCRSKTNNCKNKNNNSNSSSSHCGLRPLQQQSSLLFQRSLNQNTNSNNTHSHNNDKPTNLSILSGCNLLDLKRNNKMNGSTTSLSFSLTNGLNISNSHINTMDANSPEVQEYLFDTLRNSF